MITTATTDALDHSLAQHEHDWVVESRHPTSIGTVVYVRCGCGTRRVDLHGQGEATPSGISMTIGR
ncbi:hypothetical protein LQF12_05150 [Ruania suaedae]|uniref:hypothetical protein n=1 Tax=Ruania suaedae TaxID=2897774 RepID=UPI001E3067BB|nr:hypothetical protein [Ruania suaedae]UFU03987.1 hypothetical protein LQF12_05150 [Ruania suaedae]